MVQIDKKMKIDRVDRKTVICCLEETVIKFKDTYRLKGQKHTTCKL
jgi:hypothetical protein